MDSVIAFKTKDKVIIVTDMTQNSDVFVLDRKADKTKVLFKNHMMCLTGDPGDVCAQRDYFATEAQLRYYTNNKQIPSVKSCANQIRTEMWEAIRDHQVKCKIVYGGIEQNGQPALYVIDEYGKMMDCDKITVLDQFWKEDMTDEEIDQLIRKCIVVLNRRMFLQQQRFLVKIASKDGVIEKQIDYRPEDIKFSD